MSSGLALRLFAVVLCLYAVSGVSAAAVTRYATSDCTGQSGAFPQGDIDKCVSQETVSAKITSCNSTGIIYESYTSTDCSGVGVPQPLKVGVCVDTSFGGVASSYKATCGAATVAFNVALIAMLMVAMKVAAKVVA